MAYLVLSKVSLTKPSKLTSHCALLLAIGYFVIFDHQVDSGSIVNFPYFITAQVPSYTLKGNIVWSTFTFLTFHYILLKIFVF